jgi:hypothetical protein
MTLVFLIYCHCYLFLAGFVNQTYKVTLEAILIWLKPTLKVNCNLEPLDCRKEIKEWTRWQTKPLILYSIEDSLY